MDLERRLARIEGKVSVIANAVGLILGLVAGIAIYYFTRESEWAKWYGFGGAVAAIAFYVSWPLRGINQITDRDDE